MNYSQDQGQDSQLEELIYQTMKSNQPAAVPDISVPRRNYLSPDSPAASAGDYAVSL